MAWIGEHPQLYFLVFARVFALVLSAPLLGSRSLPVAVKAALALLTAYVVAPAMVERYDSSMEGLAFWTLLAGEALIGVIIGFFLQIIYTVCVAASHMFTIKIETENLMNVAAMAVFVTAAGFYKVFYIGVLSSFKAMTALDILGCKENLAKLLVTGLSDMFAQAVVMALPVVGVLLVMTLALGLLARLTPQINFFPGAWPLFMGVGILILALVMPVLMDSLGRFMDYGFYAVSDFLKAGGRT
ncbi:MAG: flagellar biosynthetic protein FliR [Spirochaetia bacterium]|nr:flagellar biosynthetic protein FliR [Spirochaetia bacterium]MBQ3648140.1 flagellar biosynthetic protein FliR [Spirochaetia bacterium]MBQ3713877.1 flagellar biosynthetic protein FliR [Spirochaetia bacterium]